MPETKVTVTQKRYTTLPDSKMCPQTKFGIPLSNNIGEMIFSRSEGRGKDKGHSNKKRVCDASRPKDALTHEEIPTSIIQEVCS